jgi:hypothetical protein
MKQARRPVPLSRTPIATTPDERNRQLTIGDYGGVQQLAPPLPIAVAAALREASGPSFCVRVWCDEQATTPTHECEAHGAESAAELHKAFNRIRATPSKSRKVRR